jgi:AP-1 complex subunit gamma-1
LIRVLVLRLNVFHGERAVQRLNRVIVAGCSAHLLRIKCLDFCYRSRGERSTHLSVQRITRWLCRNVAKLLYIWLLGYPTHFGYIECINLLASSSFAEKRIGYLALALLLDEKTEVLTLVTNSISKDLGGAGGGPGAYSAGHAAAASSNNAVVGLALTALANIASAEMAHDLASLVNDKLKDKSEYVRKKAALATIRLIKKAPELIDTFLPNVVVMLTDKMHNVLLTSVTLVTAIVEVDPSFIEKFTRLVCTRLSVCSVLYLRL